ncbi:MAG: homoserine O-acetyltransferase MetX [Gemmataceae bacterium]
MIAPDLEGDFVFGRDEPFRLEGGGTLSPASLRYAAYGRRDGPVVLVCHALSGSARLGEWWGELTGPGRPFDTDRYRVVCANILGSCYGSTGPRTTNPATGRPFGGDFPVVSIRDIVRPQALLLDHLGVGALHAVVGGSIGGLQALCFAELFPGRTPRCVVIGAAPLNAMGLALAHLQRQAIVLDPNWNGGHYPEDAPPTAGLALARGIAMCSYKSAALFAERFGRQPNRRTDEDPRRGLLARFDIGGYLDYQGERFLGRFDAASYLYITRAMETYDPSDEELSRVTARCRLIGIGHDWLFPPEDVRDLARRLASVGVEATYEELDTIHGHDGFLADTHLMGPVIARALEEGERHP